MTTTFAAFYLIMRVYTIRGLEVTQLPYNSFVACENARVELVRGMSLDQMAHTKTFCVRS